MKLIFKKNIYIEIYKTHFIILKEQSSNKKVEETQKTTKVRQFVTHSLSQSVNHSCLFYKCPIKI